MPAILPTYEEFLAWCRSARPGSELADVAERAVEIAENRDESNRTGHIMRGYLAAVAFLSEQPALRGRIESQPFSTNLPIDRQAVGFDAAWLPYIRRNKTRHRILKNILPESLGGNTTSGGGGAYPFKLALRLAAHFLSAQVESAHADEDRFRMVRKREFDRDSEMVRDLKRHYKDKCQVCENRIEIKRGKYYSEGHHIRPLGGDHRGEDVEENVIILCPTHHAEFDFFLMAILDKKGKRRKLEHMNRKLAAIETQITIGHTIDPANIDYAIEQFLIRIDVCFPKKT